MVRMKVFLSWSGDRSKAVAAALCGWLPEVLQQVEVFMSSDIEIGETWLAKIESELGKSDVGILCLTPANLREPWLLFEAGVLKSSATTSRVMPYLFDLTPSSIPQPLGMFQACEATEHGTKALTATLNKHTEKPIKVASIEKQFRLHWPGLKKELDAIQVTEAPSVLPDREILEEILRHVRAQNLESNRRGRELSPDEAVRLTKLGLWLAASRKESRERAARTPGVVTGEMAEERARMRDIFEDRPESDPPE